MRAHRCEAAAIGGDRVPPVRLVDVELALLTEVEPALLGVDVRFRRGPRRRVRGVAERAAREGGITTAIAVRRAVAPLDGEGDRVFGEHAEA